MWHVCLFVVVVVVVFVVVVFVFFNTDWCVSVLELKLH